MKAERFKKTKSVLTTSALALVVAAATFGIASVLVGTRSASSERVGFGLTAGSAFAITSNIYDSPACSGSTPVLTPGVTDCAVLTVHNSLTVPITVQNITTTLSSTPAGCPASNFSLPTFTGSLSVPAGGTANTTGLPISLIETGTNQDACESATLGFTYSGTALYTDSTTTVLTTSSTTPTSGQPVTLSATVTGANPSSDPSLPTGTVTFYSCPTSACSTTTAIGTGTIGSSGVATLTTSSLTAGTQYIEAVYGGQGTDYTGSTSNVVTLTVAAPSSGSNNGTAAGPGSGLSGPSSSSPTGTAFTGADISGMVAGGLILVGAGTFLVIAARRRRRTSES